MLCGRLVRRISESLRQIAVDIGRYLQSQQITDVPTSLSSAKNGISRNDLRQIDDFIRHPRGRCPTSDQLAALCDMTLSTFRLRFKRRTGKSVHRYVEEMQLERAKLLLINSDMMMKEIAWELGFTHQATFTSSFRRVTGLSPSEYRLANTK